MDLKDILKVNNDMTAMTHAGIFHADDVFATALLKMVKPEIEIVRATDVPAAFDGIVYDIGFGVYDHHQSDKRIRDNGVPYAAFGLLWEKIGPVVYGEKITELLDCELVQIIDNSDNTGHKNMISEAVKDFNTTWNDTCNVEGRFFEAVDFARGIIERKLKKYQNNELAEQYIREQMDMAQNRVLILNQGMPWKDAVIGSDIEFVVFPSNREGYILQTVPVSKGSVEPIIPLPKPWYGQSQETLPQISGIEGSIFCHNTGFLAVGDSLETVLQMICTARNVQKNS